MCVSRRPVSLNLQLLPTRPISITDHHTGASQLGSTDWFSLLKSWMVRGFPAAKFQFHNGCVPATPATFMTLCLEHYLDPQADLVFVEVGAPPLRV
jgi:hypothetical protein